MNDAAVIEAPPAVDYGPIGTQIDALWQLRESKREHEEKIKALNAVIEQKEFALFETMDAQGTTTGAGRKGKVTLGESVVPQVTDWVEFWKFIRKNNAFELLEKRAAVAAFREHASRRRDHTVPGVVPYTKRKITLGTL